MTEADRLRHEAARALRLSQLIGDKQASEALAAHAANLLERAEALERENAPPAPQAPATPQQPSQQQEQVQPKKLNDLPDCQSERFTSIIVFGNAWTYLLRGEKAQEDLWSAGVVLN